MPSPGKPLADGCYYLDSVPVLRVQGSNGTLLVPGNVHHVKVERGASDDQAWVTFMPGFHLYKRPLAVRLITELPSNSMMMEPYTSRPTIMAVTDPQGLTELVQGPAC